MNKYTEIIDKYLSKEMNPAEKASFEKQFQDNPELKAEFEIQQQLLKGIEYAGLRDEIAKGFKKGSFKNKAGKWMTGIVIAALAVATVAVVVKNKSNTVDSNENAPQTEIEKTEVVAKKTGNLPYELTEENNLNWSEADKQLRPQFFTINNKKDTVIETSGGIILSIPAHSFADSSGKEITAPVELEVKEALTPMEIMKAGLSTTSNGELLQTGGMFYVNARHNGENLKIKGKGIYANIPAAESNKNMMLFDGKRMPDGSINWVNPKRFENKLIPVNILGLDFYPEHFLDSLKRFGFDIKNKRLTDSIYYSLVCVGEQESELSESVSDFPTTSVSELAVSPPPITGTRQVVLSAACAYTSFNRPAIKTDTTPYQSCEIAPSRIRAIWVKNFNNTLLATKAFEERLQAIFKSCDHRIFKLYTDNFNKKMYEIDSMAMKIAANPMPFEGFYNKQQGGVSINESHMKKLQAYMDEKREIYEKTALATMEELYKKERISDQKAWEEKYKHDFSEIKRTTTLFYEEVQTNLEEAYRQLGRPYTRPSTNITVSSEHYYVTNYNVIPAPYYYSAPIVSTGWCNVDSYAYMTTAKRQTSSFQEYNAGKKVEIRYNPFSIKVNDFSNYDRVVAYLIPDKLSSFQLIPYKENAFKENLNALINYSAVVFGFKGDDVYCNSIAEAKSGNQTLSLSKMSQKDLANYAILNSAAKTDIISELSYQLFEHKDVLRKNITKKREEVRRKLMAVVFPCGVPPQQQAVQLN